MHFHLCTQFKTKQKTENMTKTLVSQIFEDRKDSEIEFLGRKLKCQSKISILSLHISSPLEQLSHFSQQNLIIS